MSNTTVIDYTDTDGAGTVTIMNNPFGNGKKFNAKFDRVTVNIDNLIARIQKKELGTNAIVMKQTLSLVKAEILEALSRGESVNLMDLGTFYIAASAIGDTVETVEISDFQVRFTPSKLTNDSVMALKVKKVALSSSTPIIAKMIDVYTGEETDCFTKGKSVLLTGSLLRVTGEEGGVFFAPATEKGEPSANEELWVKVPRLSRNGAKELEFYLPESLEIDTKYCIVIKTNSSKGSSTTKKSYSTAYSGVVTVK